MMVQILEFDGGEYHRDRDGCVHVRRYFFASRFFLYF
jgi:hypothetical protein